MAVASFFEKAAVSAASLLRDFDFNCFREHISRCVPGIAFDEAAVDSHEGRSTLLLAAELISRLYPAIVITPLTNNASCRSMREELIAACKRVNPLIEVRDGVQASDAVLVVGNSISAAEHSIYIGSSEWLALASLIAPVGSSDSLNPFGAGAAACFGAAFIFRHYFSAQIPGENERGDFKLSQGVADVFRFSVPDIRLSAADALDSLPLASSIDIGETFFVGVGAVGNGALWALSRTPSLTGILHLIDGECVELSNLQRYALTDTQSVGLEKVALGAAQFVKRTEGNSATSLEVRTHASTWDEFVPEFGSFAFDRVLLALDSAEDRIAVQGALPRWVANAWTQPENLGVSRHHFLGQQACVACLYKPVGPAKSEDAVYAEALGVTDPREIMEIRHLLHSGSAVGKAFLDRTAARLGVAAGALDSYAGRPLRHFYSHGLCGGVILTLGGRLGQQREMEAPMAFQSTMAGILLAAELVLDASGVRAKTMPCRSELDLLRPIGSRLNSPQAKDSTGRCICQDPAYIAAYKKKYASSALARSTIAA
jgi:Prokaryotic E2 family C/ThiF family